MMNPCRIFGDDNLYSVAIWPKHSQVTLIQHLSALVCTLDLHWSPMQSQIVGNIAPSAWTVQIGIHDGRCLLCGKQATDDHCQTRLHRKRVLFSMTHRLTPQEIMTIPGNWCTDVDAWGLDPNIVQQNFGGPRL